MDIPFYPPLARAANVHGIVRLRVTTDGERLTNVEILEGHKLLAPAAEHNVRSWKFLPARQLHFKSRSHLSSRTPGAKNYQQLLNILPDAEGPNRTPHRSRDNFGTAAMT